VVDGNAEAVDAYLSHGGNIARTLTAEEIHLLNRPSAFDVGHTLVHLAIRFQRHSILRLLLTPEVGKSRLKLRFCLRSGLRIVRICPKYVAFRLRSRQRFTCAEVGLGGS